MDFDNLFQKEAFKNMDKNTIDEIKKLSENAQGKNVNEVLAMVMSFGKKFEGKTFSEEEKDAMINAILTSMSKEERTRFKNMLEIFG